MSGGEVLMYSSINSWSHEVFCRKRYNLNKIRENLILTTPSYIISDVFQCFYGHLVVVLSPRVKRQILITVSHASHSLTHFLTQKWETYKSTAFIRSMGKGTWTSPPTSKEACVISAQKLEIWRKVETKTLLATLQYSFPFENFIEFSWFFFHKLSNVTPV